MQRLVRFVFSCLLLSLFASTTALADHMNGTFAGVDNATGAILTVKQNGFNITGSIAAQNVSMNFSGKTDGNDSANCQIQVQSNGINYSGFMTMSLQVNTMVMSIELLNNAQFSGGYRFNRSANAPATDNTPAQPAVTEQTTTPADRPMTEQSTPPDTAQPDPQPGNTSGGLPNFD